MNLERCTILFIYIFIICLYFILLDDYSQNMVGTGIIEYFKFLKSKFNINTMLIFEIVAKIRTKYIKIKNYIFPPLKDTLVIKDGKMIAHVIIQGKSETIEIFSHTLDGIYKVTVNDEPIKTFTEGVIEGSEYSNTYTLFGKYDNEFELKVENVITEESISKKFSPEEKVNLDWVTI